MKVLISVDIEGVCGVTDWRETLPEYPEYQWAAQQMTREAAAACEGAFAAGADEIWIKDAHEDARNIDPSGLPRGVRLIRGWMNSPDMMVGGLDSSFDAVLCVGYHSGAGSDGNPLSHTTDHETIRLIRLNGQPASEFRFNLYTSWKYGVPVVFLSGDQAICEEAEGLVPGITAVAVKQGVGEATINIHPEEACERIRTAVEQVLRKLPEEKTELSKQCRGLPEQFELEVTYAQHWRARRNAQFPGAYQVNSETAGFQSSSFQEVLVARMFMI